MKVIDCISYNGEADLLDLRLNILGDAVDEFIICEAPTTFSGRPKPLYFAREKERYEKWLPKIRYHIIDENYTDAERKEAVLSPNTTGARHWMHEFLQKERLKQALTHLKDNDLVFIGDCDEIWNPDKLNYYKAFHEKTGWPVKLSQIVYTYYLDNKSSEKWAGTLLTSYKEIKNECLNHVRTDKTNLVCPGGGWHFTSMGGPENLKKKLTDSYTEETYANKWVLDNLEKSVNNNKDFLGRNFTYEQDTKDWPKYLQENKERYKHLLLT